MSSKDKTKRSDPAKTKSESSAPTIWPVPAPVIEAANPFDDDATPATPGAGHEYRHMTGGIWKCERCGFQAVGTVDAPPTHPFQAGCFVPAIAGPVKTP